MTLGIDLDGVLVDFNSKFIELINSIAGEALLPPPSATFPDVWDYPAAWGVDKAITRQAWERLQEHWATLPELPGAGEAIETLDRLTMLGHRVYFITSRTGPMVKTQSEDWLTVHGMRVNVPTVLLARDEEAKGKLAWGLGLDAMIDDKPENLQAVWEHGPLKTQLFLLDAPYNQDATATYPHRVGSVMEMLSRLGLVPVAASSLWEAA
jgi:5'(3')-deoxyribonucleotidase